MFQEIFERVDVREQLRFRRPDMAVLEDDIEEDPASIQGEALVLDNPYFLRFDLRSSSVAIGLRMFDSLQLCRVEYLDHECHDSKPRSSEQLPAGHMGKRAHLVRRSQRLDLA